MPTFGVISMLVATACGTATPSATTTSTGSIAPASSTPVAGATDDWNGFHGDASRAGQALAGPIGNPVLAWRAQAAGGIPNNIAVVGDHVYFASDDGVVHALDRSSGTETWSIQLDAPSQRGPVGADGRLYLINGDGAAMALDPADGRTLWTSPTSYAGPSEIASDGQAIYFGTGDGSLVAIDAATGVEVWQLRPSAQTRRVHNPAIANGRVYVGTEGGGFVAIDTATHKVAWTGDLQGDDTGTASVGQGLAFIGTPVDTPDGHLRAFDAMTGELRWMAEQRLLQFPTVTEDAVFSATQDGLVTALDLATGAPRWSVQLQGKVRPMAVAGSVLYAGADQEQKVYAFDTATGGKLWSFDVDGSNDCCIAVARGTVFVGTLAGSVYAISGDGAAITAEPVASAPSSAPRPTPGAVADLATTVSWSTDLRGKGFAPVCQVAIDPQGRIWAPEAENDRIGIYDASGSLIEEWGGPGTKPGQFDFTRQNGDAYGTLAFAPDGSFFVLDVGNRRVQHFDAERRPLGEWGGFGSGPGTYNDPVGIDVAADGTVWVLDDKRRVVEHYDADGTVLGSFDPFATLASNDGANDLAIDALGRIHVSVVAPNEVLVFDDQGTLLDTIGEGVFDEQPGKIAFDSTGRTYVTQGPERGDAPGVLVFEANGTPLGGFGLWGKGKGQLIFPGGIALDEDGGVIVEDSLPETARLLRFELEP